MLKHSYLKFVNSNFPLKLITVKFKLFHVDTNVKLPCYLRFNSSWLKLIAMLMLYFRVAMSVSSGHAQ